MTSELSVREAESAQATKDLVFETAERLFALHGFQKVSVRDITAEAGVNLASVNYHFGSKDALLFEIFRTRAGELNRERVRLLREAGERPAPREVLRALFAPPLRWSDPGHPRWIAMQFILRARTEGTREMRESIQSDVSHLQHFADALMAARPDLPRETVYWRLHFALGMVHNNRFLEFDRLAHLSRGLTRQTAASALLEQMLDFAEAGFRA